MNNRQSGDVVSFGPGQLVNSSRMARHLSSYLDEAQEKALFITRDNNVEAVLISIESYRSLLMNEDSYEDLLDAFISLRRIMEKPELLETEAVMARYGITADMLDE